MRFWPWGTLLALAVATAPAEVGGAQTPDEASSRAPRFLVALAPSKPPRPLDVARTPALRRRISLELRGATLADALAAVSRQAGLRLMYSQDLVPLGQRVTLDARGITVAAALTELLLDANVDVLFSGTGQAVLVRRTETREVLPESGVIVGRVTDAKTGEGLRSTEMLLDGTRWRAVTDTSGRYRFDAVDVGRYTVTARRFGYAKQSRTVTVVAEQEATVNLALEPIATRLDELVSTATGEQRRRDLPNAVTTIRADSVLKAAPARNVSDLLATRVPSLRAQRTSGAPGDPTRLRLRGLGSIRASNEPIVVVDGIRVYSALSENLTTQNTITNGNIPSERPVPAPSPLDQIDPNSIEKIEVFKGPSAATLYGADAANGVIVITTKKGRPGPTQWMASVVHGRSSSPGTFPDAYFPWGHTPYSNLSILCPAVVPSCELDSLVRYQALNDPEMTILGRGHRTELSATASGGAAALTYAFTGTYSDETGLLTLPDFEVRRFRTLIGREPPEWMRRPHHLEGWGASSNLTARLGPAASVTANMRLARTEQQRSSLEAGQLPLLAATYVDKVNGLYYNGLTTTGSMNLYDPVVLLPSKASPLGVYTRKTTSSKINFAATAAASWQPRQWLTATASAGLNVLPTDDQTMTPSGLAVANFLDDTTGILSRGNGRVLTSDLHLQGAVHVPLRWGLTFTTSIGADLTTTNLSEVVGAASGVGTGNTFPTAAAGSSFFSEKRTATSSFGYYIEPRVASARFSLSTGLRLDGGSIYGGGASLTRSTPMPKLGGAWTISEEPFFPFKRLFSVFRLRAAYGQAGRQPGPVDRLRLYERSQEWLNGQLVPTSRLFNLGNTELRPERSRELEGGFDADLLDNRLRVELSGVRKTTIDAFLGVPLPGSVGGETRIMNIGKVRNTGLELTLGFTLLRLSTVTWSATLTYDQRRNTVVELGPGVEPFYLDEVGPQGASRVVAGYPVGGRWTHPIVSFADQNGDGSIWPSEVQLGDSLVYLGKLEPASTTQLFTDLTLFGSALKISAGFTYERGATQVDGSVRTNWLLARGLTDPSAPPSEQAALVVTDLFGGQPTSSSGVTYTLSTFRFNSLSIAYEVPTRMARLIGARQLSVALQGANLGLRSTYQDRDPNVNAVVVGEGVVDTGQLPAPRDWQLRLDVRY